MTKNGEPLALVGTGVALGVAHVLTGPDHLSALATLSANVNNSVEAVYLGIRWGIGHSSGLLLVGCILILLSGAGQETVDMPDYASHIFESLVGCFMILLGTYGVHKAWLKRPKVHYNQIDTAKSDSEENSSSHSDSDDLPKYPVNRSAQEDIFRNEVDSEAAGDENLEPTDDQNSGTLEIMFDGDDSPVCIPSSVGHGQDELVTNLSFGSECEEAVVVEQEYLQTVSPSRCRRWFNSITSRISNKTIAFLIGIVHGLAGPGGVLGVIPAVQLQNWKLATLYLSCFCLTSTLTMGCFAAMYAKCSSTIVGGRTGTGREFQIECFSAMLSIVVGISWLTLLYMGKLEDVFP